MGGHSTYSRKNNPPSPKPCLSSQMMDKLLLALSPKIVTYTVWVPFFFAFSFFAKNEEFVALLVNQANTYIELLIRRYKRGNFSGRVKKWGQSANTHTCGLQEYVGVLVEQQESLVHIWIKLVKGGQKSWLQSLKLISGQQVTPCCDKQMLIQVPKNFWKHLLT